MWTILWLLLAALALRADDTAENLYRSHCAPCHGPGGEGGRGPTLAVPSLPRAPDDAALSSIITLGIPGTQMPGTRMTATENRALLEYVRSLGRSASSAIPGDPAKGAVLFQKAQCDRCHTVGTRGGHSGPDLTDVGTRRSPAYLRTSIVDPQAEVPETFAVYRRIIAMPDNYLRVRVLTKDGTPIAGVRVNEDTFTIQIRDDDDRVYSFRKDELRELHKDWGKSPMPSYRAAFRDPELQDLVAYLVSLRGTR